MTHTPLQRARDFAAEHLTWLSLCGLVAVITGFTPEEWVAHLAEKLRVSGIVNGHWPTYLDIRAVLVAVGVGVIVTDVLLKRRAASRPLSTAHAAAGDTPGTTPGASVPEGDQAILTVVNLLFGPFSARYLKSNDGDRHVVLTEAIAEFEQLRKKWRMPKRVFEFYMIICLEEARILHLNEFIDSSRMVEYVTRHREFASDVGGWLAANVAGIDISET